MTGPSAEFFEYLNTAWQSPSVMNMSSTDLDALRSRVTSVSDLEDLDVADQRLLRVAHLEVNGGSSVTLQTAVDDAGADWALDDEEYAELKDDAPVPPKTPTATEGKTAPEPVVEDDAAWVGLGS